MALPCQGGWAACMDVKAESPLVPMPRSSEAAPLTLPHQMRSDAPLCSLPLAPSHMCFALQRRDQGAEATAGHRRPRLPGGCWLPLQGVIAAPRPRGPLEVVPQLGMLLCKRCLADPAQLMAAPPSASPSTASMV